MDRRFCISGRSLALASASVFIASACLAEESEEWEMVLGFPMLWAPAIEGHLEVDGNRTEIDIGFDDILKDLSLGIIGEFYASKGDWGGVLRLDYMVMESDYELGGAGPIKTTIDSKTGLGLADFLVSYRVHPDLKLITGARMLYSKIELDIESRLNGQVISRRDISVTDDMQWDWLLGFTYVHQFNDAWALMLNADYAFHGDSDRNMGVDLRGWHYFNQKHSVWFGYKVLNIFNESREGGVEAEMDLTQHGITIGYAYSF